MKGRPWFCCVALALGCGSGPAPGPLSVLWISLDTLRADHLGSYGYARDTSPFLDELAAQGTRFAWAISPQNSTLPTHMTMFTGLHPVVHGVMHSKHNPGVALAPSVRTLPKILQDRGFATRGFVDGGKLRRHFGFGGGFDDYDGRRMPFPLKLNLVLQALDAVPTDQPFFFFVHTYELHAPYDPAPPYDTLFGEGTDLDRYDGSIRFVDDTLRRFFAALDDRSLRERTLIVITSDHGESFDEYGIDFVGHGGHNLHQNITRVPWIVLDPEPARRRGVVSELVGLIDFPNTVLARLGVPERLPAGVDVLDPKRDATGSYVSYTGESWSLFADDHHHLDSEPHPGPARNATYHFPDDAAERDPLPDDAPPVPVLSRILAERREALLREGQRRRGELLRMEPLPDQTRRELEALGYLDPQTGSPP